MCLVCHLHVLNRRADSLPVKFDLRSRGVVPEIRNQDNFGTCWGFASIAACEISILSDLGLTTQEFLEKTGHVLLAFMIEAQEETETETEEDSEAIQQKMKEVARASAERIGVDFDKFLEWFEDFSKSSEEEGESYINPDTFAHYVWKNDTGIEGRIGRGESFIGIDVEWSDWIDFLEEVKFAYPTAKDYISFDNLSIKTYLYQLHDVFGEHNFGDPVTYAGGDVKLCTDCGYSLVKK